MKTLVITHDLFGADGGIARIMRLYLKAFADHAPARSVAYVTLNDRAPTVPRGFLNDSALAEQVCCGGSKPRFAWGVFRKGLAAERAACGHLHHLPLLRLARLFNPRLEYHLVAHGIEVWRPYSLIERWALRGATRILCVSEYTRRQMLRFSGELNPTNVVVVPNTFDPSFEAPAARASSVNTTAGPNILIVSRLVSSDPYKGVDTMIEAMPQLRRIYPQVRLRIVGGGDDTARLQALAEERALGDAVIFTGILSDADLRAEYQRCDMFALPSRKEGFGLVYLEAMSYGKPCLAARAGGAPEVVNQSVGTLVEYGNVEQIAIAVDDLLRHPREPDVIHAHAATFRFGNFNARLARILGQARGEVNGPLQPHSTQTTL